jgi:pimeloyl-ACP methyl ester carboxylesterase
VVDISHRRVRVEACEVFYRQAGPADGPPVLLLHGFPTASHMFRDLTPRLADRFRLVAPDLPGFGQSALLPPDQFDYSFDNLARIIERFTELIALSRFALYLFDYGAPVGLRMALRHPERITALISQSGNAYEEGLGPGWDSLREYWRHPTEAYRESLRAALTPAATRYQYTEGVLDPSSVSPDGSTLDEFYLARPGAHEVQLRLFGDYGTNVELYPQFQAYLRAHHPPVLAVWGNRDPYFLPAGATAFQRDVRDAQVEFFETGHFALETHCGPIAAAMRTFLDTRLR